MPATRRCPLAGVAAEGLKGRSPAPPDSPVVTYASRRRLDRLFINSCAGAVQRPKFASKGEAAIRGGYTTAGDVEVDTCADGLARADLRLVAGDGSTNGDVRA